MTRLLSIILLSLVVTRETSIIAQTKEKTITKSTSTRIIFKTDDVLYTGGLGDAGIQGFCKRIQTYVIENFEKRGVKVTPDADSSTPQAKIIVTLTAVETKSGVGADILLGRFGAQKILAKYSAILESPNGATLATWKHEVDEDGADKLASHMASDIVKYLKKGFK